MPNKIKPRTDAGEAELRRRSFSIGPHTGEVEFQLQRKRTKTPRTPPNSGATWALRCRMASAGTAAAQCHLRCPEFGHPLRRVGGTEGLRLSPFSCRGSGRGCRHSIWMGGHSWSDLGNPLSPKPTPAPGAQSPQQRQPPSPGVHLNTPKPQCCPVPHPSTGPPIPCPISPTGMGSGPTPGLPPLLNGPGWALWGADAGTLEVCQRSHSNGGGRCWGPGSPPMPPADLSPPPAPAQSGARYSGSAARAPPLKAEDFRATPSPGLGEREGRGCAAAPVPPELGRCSQWDGRMAQRWAGMDGCTCQEGTEQLQRVPSTP